jgi:hypothetical protein
MSSQGWDRDYRKVNPVTEGITARKQWEENNPAPTFDTSDPRYKQWQKDAAAIGKSAEEEAKANRLMAKEDYKEIVKFTSDRKNLEEAKRVRQENRDFQARNDLLKGTETTIQTYNWAQNVRRDVNSFMLSPDELEEYEGKTDESERRAFLATKPLKPEIAKRVSETMQNVRRIAEQIKGGGQPGGGRAPAVQPQRTTQPGGVAKHPLQGMQPGRYKVDGKVVKWDGTKEIR